MPANRLILLSNASHNSHEPQVFDSSALTGRHPDGCVARTAGRFLWPRLVGELLRDSEVFDGEHVRDRRSNSSAVSFVVTPIFTLVRVVHQVASGAGRMHRRRRQPSSSAEAVPGSLLASRGHSIDLRLATSKVESWKTLGR